jgi:FixJ family two-component response regulator
MVIKKIAVAAAAAMLVATMAFAANALPAYAADKVDCDAVMNELHSGKHAKEVAKDLSISTSSVYRCKKHAKAAAKASTKTSLQAQTGKDVPVAPAAAASPATTK